MIRLIHCADLHLDSAFASLPEEKAKERRKESRTIIDQLVQLCAEQRADALLLAGDLFDGETVYQETMEALACKLANLSCPVFISPGNHDPYNSKSYYTKVKWPSHVTIFKKEAIESVDCGQFVVYGAGFTQNSCQGLLDGFHAEQDGKTHIMVIHGDFDTKDSLYNPITKEQVEESNLHYLALGHIHKRNSTCVGKTTVVYPGCPEGRGFDELGDRGVYVVSIDNEQVQTTFVPIAKRKYQSIRVDVTDQEPVTAIRSCLLAGYEKDIYRITLTGQTERVNLEKIQQELQSEFYALELRDETSLPVSIWSRAGEDSLRGLFLQKLKEKAENGSEEEKKKAELAARLALEVMDHRDV